MWQITFGVSVGTVDIFRQWADAAARGDLAALDSLLDSDFQGDGPLGLVLTKREWLSRPGVFDWRPRTTRVRGELAISVGVHAHRHCTVVAVRRDGRWAVVNLQLGHLADVPAQTRAPGCAHTNTRENEMRKVILYVNLTLDGHLSGPNGELDWMAGVRPLVTAAQPGRPRRNDGEPLDPEMNVEFTDELRERVDTILTGRNFYHGLNENFSAQAKDPNSPPALVDFANWMLDTPKVVFSTRLTEVNEVSTLAAGDLADEVAALKAKPGKDMVLFGGVAAAQSFAERGLVDEYWIKLYPVALGDGQPLFTNLKDRANLRLVDSKTWGSGIITVRYVPA